METCIKDIGKMVTHTTMEGKWTQINKIICGYIFENLLYLVCFGFLFEVGIIAIQIVKYLYYRL